MKKILLGVYMLLSTINANDLRLEQSPYLLQHKDNPVEWKAWSSSTLELAKSQGKLIFLSIGYSTCHWCHVMEEESFETEEVANVLNKDYISIKVDREEMPQLDNFYQSVYQAMNRRGGGWPLTIIMTPDKKAFWSATYLPQKDLINVLTQIAQIYHTDRGRITQTATEIDGFMTKSHNKSTKAREIDANLTKDRFVKELTSSFDELNGGQGVAPKFPRATTLNAMLDLYNQNHNKELLKMATTTLTSMAKGGIYDQVEGGFYRYSVDGQWRIPHFEKMLYTQAELLRAYTKAYYITNDELYARVIRELINFVDKRFDDNGLLYSASDADSMRSDGEMMEGYYFVYDYSETQKYLQNHGYSVTQSKEVLRYFDITPDGNFEHSLSNPNLSNNTQLSDIDRAKKLLLELRAKKRYPFVDHKILTSWNAMYISSLLGTAKIDEKYAQSAIQKLDSLLAKLYIDSKLYHQAIYNKPIKVPALFEDYAFLIEALVEGYEYRYDEKYIKLAHTLSKVAIEKFYKEHIWYLSDDEYKTPSPLYDSAYASSRAVMTRALFRVAMLTDDTTIYQIAQESLLSSADEIESNPSGVATAFDTMLEYQRPYRVLKSTKTAMIKAQKSLSAIQEPSLLTKAIELDEELYIACTIDRCFATQKSLEGIVRKIEEWSQ